MRKVVLLPTGNKSIDLDNTATAMNTAVTRPSGRCSKLAQFTLNYSNEIQQIIIQYIRIHHNRIYQIRNHYIVIILPFTPRQLKGTHS